MLNQTRRSWAGRATVAVSTGALLLCAAATASAQEKTAEEETWYDPLQLDLGVGVPIASAGEYQFSGDAAIGYQLANLGIALQGSGLTYGLDTDYANSDVWQSQGAAEVWYSTGEAGSALRFQGRLSAGFAYYQYDYSPRPAAGVAFFFHDEDNQMARGNLLIGAEFRPAANVDGYLLAGGGYQYDRYGYLKLDPKDPVKVSDTTDTSAMFEARAQLRWSFLPDTLSARLRGNGSYFSLTRADELYVGQTRSIEFKQARQLEVHGRLSIEVDTLSFAGIVPFVSGGIDYVGVKVGDTSSSFTAPSVGAGLFKPVWY